MSGKVNSFWKDLLSHENMLMTYYLMNRDEDKSFVDDNEIDEETLKIVISTLESLKGKIAPLSLLDIAKGWKKRTLQDQVEVSVLMVGENHASIFLAYMDILCMKNEIGVLF